MSGEHNLELMLASLEVEQRPGTYCFVHFKERPAGWEDSAAIIEETEGVTLVVPSEIAQLRGWTAVFEAAWLTLEVHSALDAVGLTAAVAGVLADADIPCNVLAGAYHDHILVPAADADRAVAALQALRNSR